MRPCGVFRFCFLVLGVLDHLFVLRSSDGLFCYLSTSCFLFPCMEHDGMKNNKLQMEYDNLDVCGGMPSWQREKRWKLYLFDFLSWHILHLWLVVSICMCMVCIMGCRYTVSSSRPSFHVYYRALAIPGHTAKLCCMYAFSILHIVTP